jgi:hypothetical protein
MTRLSNSGKDKFLQCAHKWYIHYILRLRGAILGSPLFFGGALDEAWGHLLLEKKVDKTEEEIDLLESKTAEDLFLESMFVNKHNGENKVLSLDLSVRYSNADVDLSLLTDEDYEALRSLDDGIEDWSVFFEECKQIKRNKQELCDEDQRLLNFLSWLSLLNKGLMLIETYREEIMPQIHEVHSIQEEVTLPDEDGNVITGWIDFTASFVDDPDTIYVCDNKTASKAYALNSVETSEQLATYCEYKDTNKGAYVVGEKTIRKRDPKVRISVIKDEIPEEQFEDTFELYEEVLASIEAEDFPKNMDNDKSCFFFGQTCEYYNLCKHGNKADLVDMNKVDELKELQSKLDK